MEEFEYKGLWWFPQLPDHRVAGVLKFHPVNGATFETIGDDLMGAMLKLFGIPDERNGELINIPDNRVIDTICGFSEKGEAITLCKCQKIRINTSRGYLSSTFSVHTIFIGCHFEKESDIVFDSMTIRYTYLEQWLGISGFSGGFTINEGQYVGSEVKYTLPDRIETRVNNLNISFYHRLSVATDRFVDIHTQQFSFVEITPDTPMHYNDYHRNVISYLRNFLSLGTGKTVLPLVVKGMNKNYTLEFSNSESTPVDVDVFYVAHGASISSEKTPFDRLKMLFRYQDIAPSFEKHLQNWFAKAEKLAPVFELYFGILYIPSMYVHLEFLTLAQALESYHRRMYEAQGLYTTPEKYDAIRQTLTNAIPKEIDDDHRQSLKSRIKYGNEFSLRKRLKLILTVVLAPYDQIMKRVIGDTSTFIKKLVDTRNYLTHYTEDADATPITDPVEQDIFVQKMKILMQLCFLVELDIPVEVGNKVMSENLQFQTWW